MMIAEQGKQTRAAKAGYMIDLRFRSRSLFSTSQTNFTLQKSAGTTLLGFT